MLSDFERENILIEAKDLLDYSSRGYNSSSDNMSIKYESSDTYDKKEKFIKKLEKVLKGEPC